LRSARSYKKWMRRKMAWSPAPPGAEGAGRRPPPRPSPSSSSSSDASAAAFCARLRRRRSASSCSSYCGGAGARARVSGSWQGAAPSARVSRARAHLDGAQEIFFERSTALKAVLVLAASGHDALDLAPREQPAPLKVLKLRDHFFQQVRHGVRHLGGCGGG
jgi:hypothetical protein